MTGWVRTHKKHPQNIRSSKCDEYKSSSDIPSQYLHTLTRGNHNQNAEKESRCVQKWEWNAVGVVWLLNGLEYIIRWYIY